MIARVRKSMEEKDQGFTLIELLVVMIIIGVLAAIAVPVFLNQRVKARETAAKADVSTIGKEIATYYVDGTGGLTVSSTGTTWTLSTDVASPSPVTAGKLSGNDKAVAASGKITSGSTFCVAVETGTTGDKVWTYSASGLTASTATTAAAAC